MFNYLSIGISSRLICGMSPKLHVNDDVFIGTPLNELYVIFINNSQNNKGLASIISTNFDLTFFNIHLFLLVNAPIQFSTMIYGHVF